MYNVGIDWADQKHDIAIVDSKGNMVMNPISIPKSHRGFERLLTILRQLSDSPQHFRIGIETPHNLIVDFLVDLDYPVFALFPGVMPGLRKRYRVSGAHDDVFDAFVLADTVRTDSALRSWRRINFDNELTQQIRILARDHHILIGNQVVFSNSLRATLNLYYPEYIHFFKDVACKTSVAFIQAYPDFESARELSLEQIVQFFKQRHYNNKKALNKIHTILQKEHLTVARPLLEAKKLKAVILAQKLETMSQDIELYVNRLSELVDSHPDGELFLSYPGIAHVTAARLISLFGDDRDRFSSLSEVQALVGSCPVTEKSGKSHRAIYFRRACNKYYRDSLHQLSFASIRESPWAKAYYKKHRARGKKHNHTLRCLANIHLRILYTMWENRTHYDENLFLAQRARHKLALVA
jgi:transposase